MREVLFSPFGNLHARSCAIDSGPWGNNAHCFSNKGSTTLATGKYYQDSANADRRVCPDACRREACLLVCARFVFGLAAATESSV
jgi:hypothetical protein